MESKCHFLFFIILLFLLLFFYLISFYWILEKREKQNDVFFFCTMHFMLWLKLFCRAVSVKTPSRTKFVILFSYSILFFIFKQNKSSFPNFIRTPNKHVNTLSSNLHFMIFLFLSYIDYVRFPCSTKVPFLYNNRIVAGIV